MARLVWVVAGFLLGVIVSRNAQAMSHPVASAVVLGVLVAVGVAWWAGRRDKASAVAVAVAHAEARAAAAAEAQAAAIAQAAVHLHLAGAGVGATDDAGPRSVARGGVVGRHVAGIDGEVVELVESVNERSRIAPLQAASTDVAVLVDERAAVPR